MHTRTRRAWFAILALALWMTALPMQAYAAPKPEKAVVSETSVTIDLATAKTLQLSADVLPEDASQRVIWTSSKKAVATVSSKGKITAKKVGNAVVRVRPYGVKKWTNIKVKVTDSLRPTSISLPEKKVKLGKGDKYELKPEFLPETASQDARYSSNKPKVATVNSSGVITAKGYGTAAIRVRSKRNTGLSKVVTVTVSKGPAPSKIELTPSDKTMTVGQKLQLSAAVRPDSVSQNVSWSSNNKKIATVTNTGEVTALKEGTVKITVKSKAKSSVKVVRTIKVTDPNKPTKIAFTLNETIYLTKSDIATLDYTVTPATARRDATFSSSNKKIVSVDDSGRIVANEVGTATITVTAKGTSLKDTIKISVYNSNRTTLMPDKVSTSESDIKENLAKIDAIRESAYNEIAALKSTGRISAGEASLRKGAVTEAFANYGFAWMTPAKVNYWDSSLSQNNFQPNRIYYGMPYIQCGANQNYANRQFTLSKAVSQKYFQSKSGYSRYYQMTDKRLNKFYVGCDCSTFVSMSVWGLNHAASFYNTTAMAKSNYYKTITDMTAIRPGDLLVKSGKHTVMFLYNCEGGIMIIENGGGTVSCKLTTLQAYLGTGYVIKRPLKFA